MLKLCHDIDCDSRGRDLRIENISNGARITIYDTYAQTLEHTWRILNVNGSASQIRLWKISRLNNTMSDDTYIYDYGDWTKFDNISQTSEELVATGDINEDGYKREERILRDADNMTLSHTITESRRFGSFANAVLRQTYYAEKSWGDDNWNESFASYYTDNDNPKRNGNVHLEWGNARAWRFCAYDTEGRTILTLDQRDGSECPQWPLNELAVDAFDSQDIVQWLGNQSFTAIATICDYTPLAGDDAAAVDADKVLVEDGTVTLIGRTWTRYTHGVTNGYATVMVETTTAGAQDAAIGDSGNAVATETRHDDAAAGIPLVLRGEVVSSTDTDGIATTYLCWPRFNPDYVSFTALKTYESETAATNVTGIFTNIAEALVHGQSNGGGKVVPVLPGNYILMDFIGGSLPNAFLGEEGGWTWNIKNSWFLEGSTVTNTMSWSAQRFYLSTNGTFSVSKFGHFVSRGTNNVYTISR